MNVKRHRADKRDSDCSPAMEDPFLVALAAAEQDDEPVTDDDRAAAQAGWDAYVRGDSTPWEEVRKSLGNEVAAAKRATP